MTQEEMLRNYPGDAKYTRIHALEQAINFKSHATNRDALSLLDSAAVFEAYLNGQDDQARQLMTNLQNQANAILKATDQRDRTQPVVL